MSHSVGNPFIVLQPNWNEILWQNGGKAWVYLKHPSLATVHGEILNAGASGDDLSVAHGFVVKEFDKHSIGLEFPQYKVATKFIAPLSVFTDIHSNNVTSMDISVRGGLGVSTGRDETLVIWDTKSGSIRRKLSGHIGEVECCRFFPSGVVVLSGGMDTQLKIWSAEDGSCARTLNGHHKRPVRCVEIVDKGKNIVSCSADGSVRLWDCGSAQQIACIAEDREEINCCSITSATDEMLEILDCKHRDITKHDLESGTENKLLFIGCENGFLEGYHLASRTKCYSLQMQSAVNCCCFINSNLLVAGCHDGTICAVDLEKSVPPLMDCSTKSPVLSIFPSHISNHTPCFWASFGDGRCSLMQVTTEQSDSGDSSKEKSIKVIVDLTGPDCDAVYKVVESQDGYLYTACRDGFIRKYKIPNT